jgi:hypothetical protein
MLLFITRCILNPVITKIARPKIVPAIGLKLKNFLLLIFTKFTKLIFILIPRKYELFSYLQIFFVHFFIFLSS